MIKTKWIDQSNDKDGVIRYIALSVTEGNEIIATGRISINGGVFFLEDIFVPEDRRGMGYGDFAARLMIRKCFELGGVVQQLVTPVTAARFFERLGFSICGRPYETPRGIFVDMIRRGDVSGNCGESL